MIVRRPGREPDAIDVELVETTSDDEALEPPEPPASGDGAGPDGTDTGARHWSWRKRVTAGLAVGLVVAAFVGVGALQSARHEAARQKALAGSPGLVPPIDGPLEELWRMDGSALMAESAGLMILEHWRSQEGTGRVLAVEPFTGDVVWDFTPPQDGPGYTWCQGLSEDDRDTTSVRPAGGAEGPDGGADGPGGPQTPLIACLTTIDRGARGLGDWEPTTSLHVLEAPTGREVLAVTDPGSLMMWDVVDGDVAMLLELPGGHVTATRLAVPDGEPVWTYRSDEPVTSGGGAVAWGTWPEGRFVIQGQRSVVLDLETGEAVPEPSDGGLPVTPMPPVRTPLPDGGTVEWTPSMTGLGTGRVLDPDGSERFALTGPVAWMVSDDSVPERIVLERQLGDDVFAVIDAGDGHVVWEGETAERPVARLDGLLVVVGVDLLRGVRIRDGVEQWSLTAMYAHQSQVLTDGNVLLVRRDAGSQRIVAAVDATDGTERWQMSLPEDVSYLSGTSSGPIVGYAGEGLIAYG